MEAIAASVDITPSRLLPAACNGPINAPSNALGLAFEANILAIREHGQTVVVLTLDWFFVSPGLRSRILDRCAGKLADSSLFVAASHTHTSPATDWTKVGFSTVDDVYVTSVEDAIASRIRDILSADQWRGIRLRFTTTACDCSINRRRRVWRPKGFALRRGISAYPNPSGPRLPVVRARKIITIPRARSFRP